MQRLQSIVSPIARFWANRDQRRAVMWVIWALSLAILAFGGFNILTAQNQYNDLSHDLDGNRDRIAVFESQFPEVERDGEMVRDLTSATEADKMLIMTLKTDERKTYNERVDAENDRAAGIRIVGYGVVGLALGYLFAPESAHKRNPDAPTPPAAAVPPSDDSA